MDCLVYQNKLPGRYALYLFQGVRNTDQEGVEHLGYYYHVRVNEEMEKATLNKGCESFIISVSLPCNRSLSDKESTAEPPKPKQ